MRDGDLPWLLRVLVMVVRPCRSHQQPAVVFQSSDYVAAVRHRALRLLCIYIHTLCRKVNLLVCTILRTLSLPDGSKAAVRHQLGVTLSVQLHPFAVGDRQVSRATAVVEVCVLAVGNDPPGWRRRLFGRRGLDIQPARFIDIRAFVCSRAQQPEARFRP